MQSRHAQIPREMHHANSGPAMAMIRLPSSTAGAEPRSMRMKPLCTEHPCDCQPLPDLALLVRHVQGRGAADAGERPAHQRQTDGLRLGHDRPDMGRAMPVPAEAVAGEAAVRPLGDVGQLRSPGVQIFQNDPALEAAAPAVEIGDVAQIVRAARPDREPRRCGDRRLDRALGAPARDGIHVAEAERQVDRSAEFGGVEAHGAAGRLDGVNAAPQEPRAMALAAFRLRHQHHADPGDLRSRAARPARWRSTAPRRP